MKLLTGTTSKIKAMKSTKNVLEANSGFKGPVVIRMNQSGSQQACALVSGDVSHWKLESTSCHR
jgi:hypothetical protein